jgi:hypothetical protein
MTKLISNKEIIRKTMFERTGEEKTTNSRKIQKQKSFKT